MADKATPAEASNNNSNQPVTAADIRAKALGALNKSAREALDQKIKTHMTKRLEAEKTVKQIDALIDADIDAFLAGL